MVNPYPHLKYHNILPAHIVQNISWKVITFLRCVANIMESYAQGHINLAFLGC